MYDREARTRVDLHGRRLVSPRHAPAGCGIIRGSCIVRRVRDGSARTRMDLRRRRLVSAGDDAARQPVICEFLGSRVVNELPDRQARSGMDLLGRRLVSAGNDTAR